VWNPKVYDSVCKNLRLVLIVLEMSEAHAVKRMEVKFHKFKASVLGRGDWPVSRTSPLYSWERKNLEYKDVQAPEQACAW
jgi:hypothetical protein